MRKIIIILAIFLPLKGLAQMDSIKAQYKAAFDQFRQEIGLEHKTFLSRNDSLFHLFLKDSWKSFSIFKKELDVKPKPVSQPVVPDSLIMQSRPTEIFPTDQHNSSFINSIENLEIKTPNETDFMGTFETSFDFYGSMHRVYAPGMLPFSFQLSGPNIEAYYAQTASLKGITFLVSQLLEIKKKLRLNDWGYYKLTGSISEGLSPEKPEQQLFHWILLLKSGYNAKIGYSGNNAYVLMPSRQEVYNLPSVRIGDSTYYIFDNSTSFTPSDRIIIHQADFPGNSSFSMEIGEIPAFIRKTTTKEIITGNQTVNISLDAILLNFMNDYPLCDMSVYFSAPLSSIAGESLDKILEFRLKGKTVKQKVAYLLEFIQRSFPYMNDMEQFGGERYLFPDEVLHYPGSDCEDRAILFTRLVRRYTSLSCIGLDFPGHVSAAVCVEGEGDFLFVDGRKYLICDPTWLNAPVGYLPEEYKKMKPKIIRFE